MSLQTPVQTLLRQAVRDALVRVHWCVSKPDIFAEGMTTAVAMARDEELIDSHTRTKALWTIVQYVLTRNRERLLEAALDIWKDEHSNDNNVKVDVKCAIVQAIVRRLLTACCADKTTNRLGCITALHSILAETILISTTPQRVEVVRRITSAVACELHVIMQGNDLVEVPLTHITSHRHQHRGIMLIAILSAALLVYFAL